MGAAEHTPLSVFPMCAGVPHMLPRMQLTVGSRPRCHLIRFDILSSYQPHKEDRSGATDEGPRIHTGEHAAWFQVASRLSVKSSQLGLQAPSDPHPQQRDTQQLAVIFYLFKCF